MSIVIVQVSTVVPGGPGAKCFIPFWEADDEWDAKTVVVDVSLASRMSRAVVGPEEDDRIVEVAMRFELCHHVADVTIDLCERIIPQCRALASQR